MKNKHIKLFEEFVDEFKAHEPQRQTSPSPSTRPEPAVLPAPEKPATPAKPRPKPSPVPHKQPFQEPEPAKATAEEVMKRLENLLKAQANEE